MRMKPFRLEDLAKVSLICFGVFYSNLSINNYVSVQRCSIYVPYHASIEKPNTAWFMI